MTVERIADDQTPGEIIIGYYDCARDYQTGLQRAHFGVGRRSERIELPAALMPGEAKALAERKMAEVSVRSVTSRSEEHTSELQSLMRISYAVFCLTKKPLTQAHTHSHVVRPHARQ